MCVYVWGGSAKKNVEKKSKNIFVGHIPTVSQEAISQTEERMKITEKKMKDNIKKTLFDIPLVLCFHSNHFHNTVTFKGACGAAYVFLTRLWPYKRKPRGDTERKKIEGKKRLGVNRF